MDQPTLGFVGLGQMGAPMALNLLKGGHTLIACDRDENRFAPLTAHGAACSTDLAEPAGADIVFLCLPNGEAVEAVLAPGGGLGRHLRPGQTVVDLSTVDHAVARRLGQAMAERGVDFLDAPVTGMPIRAADGTLTVMCGGAAAVFERVRPLLELVGTTVLHMGPAGSGQLSKMLNNMLFDINCAALAEVLPVATKMGLDPAQFGAVVNSGSGGSYASAFFIPRILAGRFGDGYPMGHAYKDLVGGAALSAELPAPMPVLAAATATYQAALLQGLGEQDKGAMVQVFERLLGVQVRAGPAA